MSRDAIIDRSQLPATITKDLAEAAAGGVQPLDETVASVLHTWLQYNGIFGFTNRILSIFEAAQTKET